MGAPATMGSSLLSYPCGSTGWEDVPVGDVEEPQEQHQSSLQAAVSCDPGSVDV